MKGHVTLTPRQRSVLLETLSSFAPPIERVDAYGSRANGNARPGSDIDLVLAGPIDWTTLVRVSGALDDSYLSISADVKAYDQLPGGAFRDRVLATAVTLFDRDELTRTAVSSGRGA